MLPEITREELKCGLNEFTHSEYAKLLGISKIKIWRWCKYYNLSKFEILNIPNALSSLQQDIITGNLLGDGHLLNPRKVNHNSYFVFSQSVKRKNYLEYIHAALYPFSLKIGERIQRKPSIVNNKINHDLENWQGEHSLAYYFSTISHPIFSKLRTKWYSDRQKIIPNDIQLNWRIIAFWFADDGQNRQDKREAIIYTNCFPEHNVILLINKLKELGIKSYLNFKANKPIIRISCGSYCDFMFGIHQYLFKICSYKCDVSKMPVRVRKTKCYKL